tara:strand:+ start:432 stop:1322 length:891 start_codon:yes stop_codon:yes gene_type:complete
MEVYMTNKDWNTVLNYAKYAEDSMSTEIGGMAVTIEDEEGNWQIKHPVILKQEVTGGTCDLDKGELAKYYSKMAITYKKYNMRFCWWHSHASMNAFWSGTDISTIDEYKDGDLSFALVVNIKGEYKCRVSVWKPIEFHKDVDLEIIDEPKAKIPKRIINEVDELCSKPAVTSLQTNMLSGNEITSWNNSFKSASKEKEDPMEKLVEETWEVLVEKVDELNDEMTMGNKKYAEYSSTICKLNDKLKSRNIPLKIRLISKNTIEELMYITGHALVKCTNPKYINCDPIKTYGGYYGYY